MTLLRQTKFIDCWSRHALGGLLVVMLCAVAMFSCGGERGLQAAEPTPQESHDVEVISAEQRPIDRSIRVVGSIRPFDMATLRAKASGYVETIFVDIGDPVERGQLLMQLEEEDYRLALDQAEAAVARARARLGIRADAGSEAPLPEPEQTGLVMRARSELDEAQRNLARQRELHESGLLSTADLDQAQTAFDTARHQLQEALEEALDRHAALLEAEVARDMAAKLLRDTRVMAPFDGIVQERFANVGEYLSEDAPILSLVSQDKLRVQLNVPERQAGRVRVGQTIYFQLEDHPDSPVFTSTVSRLTPSLQQEGRALLVEGDHAFTESLRPGVFVRGRIVVEARDLALAVPESAVVAFVGIERVLIMEDDSAREVEVETGQRQDGWVEIRDGLEVGDLVIRNPLGIGHGDAVRYVMASD